MELFLHYHFLTFFWLKVHLFNKPIRLRKILPYLFLYEIILYRFMRFFLVVLVITFHMSFLHAEEPSFNFTFGSNLANIPIEINKMNKNIKTSTGIKINSWILSPNFSSFLDNKKFSKVSKNKNFKEKESLYIKFKFKF